MNAGPCILPLLIGVCSARAFLEERGMVKLHACRRDGQLPLSRIMPGSGTLNIFCLLCGGVRDLLSATFSVFSNRGVG